MNREILDYIEDIIGAMTDAVEFTGNMDYEEFISNKKTIYAVIRAIEIIGEAAKQVPSSVRKKYPEIPWKNIAGMRDKLIHSYFAIKLDIVWDTVKTEIPRLKPLFDRILEDYQEDSDDSKKN